MPATSRPASRWGPSIDDLRGKRILILNWKDIEHPAAGGAEQYIHEIALRWSAAGVDVTWLTARPKGASGRARIEGMPVVRGGGTFSVYPHAAAWLVRHGRKFDAIVDCQNGIPFFAPLFVGGATAVVQVVHHVHQAQFGTHFPAPLAMLGRFLEGPAAARVYGRRPMAAVSVSTREQVRSQLGLTGPIYIVPNGAVTVGPTAATRSAGPTICLVTRLAPHKRVDELIRLVARIRPQVPDLHVDIVGSGSQERQLRDLVAHLGLTGTVRMHGRLADAARDELLGRAWLTASLSDGEGWSCSVIEAAAWGVPCVSRFAPGVCDSIIDGVTGWLVRDDQDLDGAVVRALRDLASPAVRERMADRCRQWAARFSWDRSAGLLAGVVTSALGPAPATDRRRNAGLDRSAVVSLPPRVRVDRTQLRPTDESAVVAGRQRLLLHDCDPAEAKRIVRDRLRIAQARVHQADRHELLAGAGVTRSQGAWPTSEIAS